MRFISADDYPDDLWNWISYDPETGVISRINYPVSRLNGPVSRTDRHGYVVVQFRHRDYFAHRLAWLAVHGSIPDKAIDHINRVRTDNRIVNLRVATVAENACNRLPSHKRNDLPKGVTLHATGKFQARIGVARKNHHLGIFDTPEDAHLAYCAAASRLHGSFARTS